MGIFNERFKELKETKDIMLKDLAAELDTSSPKLSNYLNGNAEPSYEFLVKIAKHFDVTTDYLTGMSDYKNSNEEMLAKDLQEQSNLTSAISDENKKRIDDNSIMLHNSLIKLTTLVNKDNDLNELWEIVSLWNEGLLKYITFVESFQNDTFDLEEGRKAMINFSQSRIVTNHLISTLLSNIIEQDTVNEDLKKQIITRTSYAIKPIKHNDKEASVEKSSVEENLE